MFKIIISDMPRLSHKTRTQIPSDKDRKREEPSAPLADNNLCVAVDGFYLLRSCSNRIGMAYAFSTLHQSFCTRVINKRIPRMLIIVVVILGHIATDVVELLLVHDH